MSIRKNRLLVLTALSIALSVSPLYAGAKNPGYKGYKGEPRIFIPDPKPPYEINLGLLFLKPGASNLNYAILNKELPAQSPGWVEQEIVPGYAPAFELSVRAYLPESAGKDINLDWTHLSSSSSESTTADGVNYFIGPDWEIGPDAIPIRSAKGNVQFKYDVVNLDVGQYVNFGRNLRTRLYGGLSAGFLREQVTATYSGTDLEVPGPFSTQQKVTSNFTGIGPRFGISADYDIGAGFGLTADTAASALIGAVHAKTSYQTSSPILAIEFDQDVNYQTIKDQNVYQVVPGFSGKIGVDYNFAYSQYTMFNVTLGYQAAVYINAISQYLPSSVVEPIETGGRFCCNDGSYVK